MTEAPTGDPKYRITDLVTPPDYNEDGDYVREDQSRGNDTEGEDGVRVRVWEGGVRGLRVGI